MQRPRAADLRACQFTSFMLGSECHYSVKLHTCCREHLTCQTCMLYFVHGIRMGCFLPRMCCVARHVSGRLTIRWNPPVTLRTHQFVFPHGLWYFAFLFVCSVFQYHQNLDCVS